MLSSAQTDQSQFSFPAGFQHKIEHALYSTSFWHQKNLAPEKYYRLTSFWYQMTGTRNRYLKLASVPLLEVTDPHKCRCWDAVWAFYSQSWVASSPDRRSSWVHPATVWARWARVSSRRTRSAWWRRTATDWRPAPRPLHHQHHTPRQTSVLPSVQHHVLRARSQHTQTKTTAGRTTVAFHRPPTDDSRLHSPAVHTQLRLRAAADALAPRPFYWRAADRSVGPADTFAPCKYQITRCKYLFRFQFLQYSESTMPTDKEIRLANWNNHNVNKQHWREDYLCTHLALNLNLNLNIDDWKIFE